MPSDNYRYSVLKSGTSGDGLQQLYEQRDEVFRNVNPNDRLEFYCRLNNPYVPLQVAGQGINSTLSLAGVGKWQDMDRYVLVDDNNEEIKVRWIQGNPWYTIVIGAVLVLAALSIAIWQVRRVLPELEVALPEIARVAVPLLVIVAGIFFFIPRGQKPIREARPP